MKSTKMNELYMRNAKYMCRGCMKISEDLHIMNASEISWFQNYVKVHNWTGVMKICFICKYLLRKFANFALECEKIDQLMINGLEEDLTCYQAKQKPPHNYITTNPVIHYFGQELDSIKSDDLDKYSDELYRADDQNCDDEINKYDEIDDEDVPLVMLKSVKEEVEIDVKVRKKSKKKLHKVSYNHEKQDSIKEKGKKKEKKQLKEGFSSRMVQETNEYEVIRLTKEQVIQEMEEKTKCDKYLRSVYKCEKCAKGFNFKDVIENHMKKHSKEHGTLKCDICTQYCPSAVSLRGHMKSHTTRYKCKICGAVRISRQHLLEHYSIEHTVDASDYTCMHCPFTTKKRTVIQRHVRAHKTKDSLTCSVCGARFTNMNTLRMHASRHDTAQRFSCSQCNMKFIYPSLLHRHMRSHTHRDHYCVECDVTFKSLDNLRLHFKRAKKHRDPSTYKYKCSQCDERFISQSAVLAHLSSSHGAAKTHPCGHCGKMYSSRESVKSHVQRAHAAAARVRCDACQKEFCHKSVLAKHLRTCAAYSQGPMNDMKKSIPNIDIIQTVDHET